MSSSRLREAAIRPPALMDEQARLFAEDAAMLMSHASDFITVPCPACGATEYEKAFHKTGMPFVTCLACETLFANPRPRPEHLEDYYRNARHYAYWSREIFPASEAARRENVFRPRVRRLLDLCRRFQSPTRVLLEVGAGFGIFCEEMHHCGGFERVIAVEPTPNLAEDCRRRGLEVIEAPIEQVDRRRLLGDSERIDVIASFEVIEHLFSPSDFIRQCANLLEPDGLLMLSCPNGKGFDLEVLREKSTTVDVEHINLFNSSSLSRLLQNNGFEVLDVCTPGQLDAELVRNALLNGELDPDAHPFLRRILLDEWRETGAAFQDFLAANRLSSHMLITACKG